MKKITFFFCFILFSSISYGMTVEESINYHKEIQERYAKQVEGEIIRAHELAIETEKFKNAIMLERAGASVNYNYSSSGVSFRSNNKKEHRSKSK